MRRLIFSLAALLFVPSLAAAATVTLWIPGDVDVDAPTARVATVARVPGNQVKFSKACAKAAGKFDTFTATVVNAGLGTVQVTEIAVEKLPGKGLAMDLSSLRAEGDCTNDGKKWRRFSAVLTEADTKKGAAPKATGNPATAPAPAPAPKKDEKKKDAKPK
jgi:hypothetical protein